MSARTPGRNPSLKTPLCSQLGIDLPIVQAPMAGGWTTPALVAAAPLLAGQGLRLARKTSSAAEIVATLEEEIASLVERLQRSA